MALQAGGTSKHIVLTCTGHVTLSKADSWALDADLARVVTRPGTNRTNLAQLPIHCHPGGSLPPPLFSGACSMARFVRPPSMHLSAFVLSGHLKLLGRPIPSLVLSRLSRRRRPRGIEPAPAAVRSHDPYHYTTGAIAGQGALERGAS